MSSRAQIGLHQELQAMHLRPHYSQKAQHRHTHSHPAISPRRLVRACARLAQSIRLVLCADILTARTGDECKVATCRSHAQTKANKATVPRPSLCTVVLPLTSLKQRTAERDYKTDRTAPGSVVHPAAKKKPVLKHAKSMNVQPHAAPGAPLQHSHERAAPDVFAAQQCMGLAII